MAGLPAQPGNRGCSLSGKLGLELLTPCADILRGLKLCGATIMLQQPGRHPRRHWAGRGAGQETAGKGR